MKIYIRVCIETKAEIDDYKDGAFIAIRPKSKPVSYKHIYAKVKSIDKLTNSIKVIN